MTSIHVLVPVSLTWEMLSAMADKAREVGTGDFVALWSAAVSAAPPPPSAADDITYAGAEALPEVPGKLAQMLEQIANKEPGFGMSYHAQGISGRAEIHLYGKRAEAAHWLMENGSNAVIAAAPHMLKDTVERAYAAGYDEFRNKWIGDHEEMAADLVRLFVPRIFPSSREKALEVTPVPNWLIAFLRGEDHWPGHPEVGFGDTHPTERGAFFWRKHLAPTPLSPSPREKALEEALRSLIAKLDECAPHISDAFAHMLIRYGDYTGPNYSIELETARVLVDAKEQI